MLKFDPMSMDFLQYIISLDYIAMDGNKGVAFLEERKKERKKRLLQCRTRKLQLIERMFSSSIVLLAYIASLSKLSDTCIIAQKCMLSIQWPHNDSYPQCSSTLT